MTIDDVRTAAQAKGLTVRQEAWPHGDHVIFISAIEDSAVASFWWSEHRPMTEPQAIAAAKHFIDGWPYEPLTFEAVQEEADWQPVDELPEAATP